MNETGKITPLFADAFPQPREPSPVCVAELERLLAAAKVGEIVGVVATVQHHDGFSAYSIAGKIGSYSLIGAMTAGLHRLLRLDEED